MNYEPFNEVKLPKFPKPQWPFVPDLTVAGEYYDGISDSSIVYPSEEAVKDE